jgi:hypothetical protein
MFEGVNVNRGQGALNRQNASTDGVMALVAYSPSAGTGAYNTAYRLIEPAGAVTLGYGPAYDSNGHVIVHGHVTEFFRLAPGGTLILIVTDKTTAKAFFESVEAKALFRQNSDVKRIAYAYNGQPAALNMVQELAAAQLFIDDMAKEKILFDGIYLEGRNLGAAAVTLRTNAAPQCSVVIAQDPAVAVLDAAYAKYAAVGSALGMRAARKVNENLGSVDIINKPNAKKGNISYPLTDRLLGKWLSANLSDGTAVTPLSGAVKKQLTDYGYIYAGSFPDFDGVYFNGEPTCVELSSDYSTGENNGVWNKAARGIRIALLPKVRGWFKRDLTSGNLKATAITSLENTGRKPLDEMMAREEISAYEFGIPADQNPNDQTPLKVKVSVTLGAIIHTFDVDLSLN